MSLFERDRGALSCFLCGQEAPDALPIAHVRVCGFCQERLVRARPQRSGLRRLGSSVSGPFGKVWPRRPFPKAKRLSSAACRLPTLRKKAERERNPCVPFERF